ncbi:hypothetical protein A3Q56_04965 [Intoshia linei]|uniref:Alpha-1,4-N-acetylglucosaminyltransferase n=1 Tax=Intoshia linei TaxID=1819745 RepID=A0A177B0W8_9BILA|nr:hypothetical protein A3Q56_04965 [Intoshia linei]
MTSTMRTLWKCIFLIIGICCVIIIYKLRSDLIIKYRNWISQNHSKKNESLRDRLPSVVHFTWYVDKISDLKFHEYTSILSAHRNFNVDRIHFYTNNEPKGELWNKILNELMGIIYIIYRTPPSHELLNEKFENTYYATSASNVDRVLLLYEYGGIYMDMDVIAIQPIPDYVTKSCFMGLESEQKLCGSFIACEANSPFLAIWLNSYLTDYRIEEWSYNSGMVPTQIAKRFPKMIHLSRLINQPNFKHLDQIWGNSQYNWKNNIAMHIWYRLYTYDQDLYDMYPDSNFTNILTNNRTIDQIYKFVHYKT